MNSTLIILFYFVIGFVTIIVVRTFISGFGLMSEQIEEKVLKIKKEEDYIVGLIKALERKGMKDEDIEDTAKEAGFDKDKVYDMMDKLGK